MSVVYKSSMEDRVTPKQLVYKILKYNQCTIREFLEAYRETDRILLNIRTM